MSFPVHYPHIKYLYLHPDEFIKLGQALKKASLVGSGVDAKMVIQDGQVQVNGQTELQRGKKLHDGDVVTYDGETIQIVK